MKLRISERPIVLKERLQKLGNDMFITDYAGDIVKLLVNKPKPYRFLYDAQADLYMICDAWDYIHSDMVVTAFENGWYSDQKDFCEIFTGFYNSRCGLAYFSSCMDNTPFEKEEFDDSELSLISKNVNQDEDWVYGWLYCFGFIPSGSNGGDSMTDDGYDKEYDFSFGTVYTRGFDLSETKDIKSALERENR